MNRTYWILLAIVLLIGAGVVRSWMRSSHNDGQPGRPIPATTNVVGPANVLDAREPRVIEALPGYLTWPLDKQRRALADLERAPVVDPETTRFLVTLIRDNNQTPNIRNLAANALTVPGRWVAGLADVFLRQAQDPSEDPMWRDYALQHAGTLAIHGQDVDRVVPVLETVALSTSPSAGTAFLMLHRIVTAQHTIFNTTVLRTLVTSVAHDPVRDINTTVVVLGVLGEMRNAAYSADLRPLLACPAPTVRRAAAGLFGLVGSAHDIDGLRQLTNDADVSVAAAADIAIRRLANQKSN